MRNAVRTQQCSRPYCFATDFTELAKINNLNEMGNTLGIILLKNSESAAWTQITLRLVARAVLDVHQSLVILIFQRTTLQIILGDTSTVLVSILVDKNLSTFFFIMALSKPLLT